MGSHRHEEGREARSRPRVLTEGTQMEIKASSALGISHDELTVETKGEAWPAIHARSLREAGA